MKKAVLLLDHDFSIGKADQRLYESSIKHLGRGMVEIIPLLHDIRRPPSCAYIVI